MSEQPRPPKVFFSYSHDSPKQDEEILALADRLRTDGIDALIDQYESAPPRGWARWMRDEIRCADFVLVICTEAYKRRAEGNEEPGKGRGANREGLIIDQHIYESDGRNEKFIAVTLRRTDTPFIPDFLGPYQSESTETDAGYDKLYRRLTNQPEVVKPALGKPRPLAPRQHMHGSSIQQNPPGASASVPVAPILATPPPALKAPRFDLTNLHVTRVPAAPTGYQFRFDLINVGHEAARDLEGKIVMIPLNYWRPPIVIPFSIGNEVFPNTQLSYVSRGVSLDPHSSERYIRISFQYRGGGDGPSLNQDFSYVWGGIPNFVPSNLFSYPEADVQKRLNEILDSATRC